MMIGPFPSLSALGEILRFVARLRDKLSDEVSNQGFMPEETDSQGATGVVTSFRRRNVGRSVPGSWHLNNPGKASTNRAFSYLPAVFTNSGESV